MSMKNFNETIGNRTRDLPACVPDIIRTVISFLSRTGCLEVMFTLILLIISWESSDVYLQFNNVTSGIWRRVVWRKVTDVLGWLGAFLYLEYGDSKFLRNVDKFWLLRTALYYLRAGNLLHGCMSIYCTSELAGEGYRPSSSFSSSVLPLPVAAQTKAWGCGRRLAVIAGSNLAGLCMSCLLWVLCVVRYRSLRRADHSSRGVLLIVCLCHWVCVIRCNSNPLQLQWVGRKGQTKKKRIMCIITGTHTPISI